jgi:membrane protein DedA with SNARE-associated domain
MTVSELVTSYGYYAVFFGALLEGETILIFAGFAAHRGMLDLRFVITIAFVASTLGDQIFFHLGRLYGVAILSRFPVLRARVPAVQQMLNKYHTMLIPAVRFLYGLRIAGPVVIGISGVSSARFALLNMIGALVWAVTIALAGYYFGALLELLLNDIKHFEEAILLGILLAGCVIWLWRRSKDKK